jgi:20S proteasome alpha/beta subunit
MGSAYGRERRTAKPTLEKKQRTTLNRQEAVSFVPLVLIAAKETTMPNDIIEIAPDTRETRLGDQVEHEAAAQYRPWSYGERPKERAY